MVSFGCLYLNQIGSIYSLDWSPMGKKQKSLMAVHMEVLRESIKWNSPEEMAKREQELQQNAIIFGSLKDTASAGLAQAERFLERAEEPGCSELRKTFLLEAASVHIGAFQESIAIYGMYQAGIKRDADELRRRIEAMKSDAAARSAVVAPTTPAPAGP